MPAGLLEPIVAQFEQLLEAPAAMVAGDRFVEVPPDALNGVVLGRVLGQEVDNDAVPPAGEVLLYRPALVWSG